MNHLEQLVGEWLQYKGYLVRLAVPVGPRPNGGFEGELDVIALHFSNQHLLHVECSLDADAWVKRDQKFQLKFERGRKFIKNVLAGIPLPEKLDQVCILQFASGERREIGGGRLITVRDLIHEIFHGLEHTSPGSGAVPSNFPLLRTLQLAAYANKSSATIGARLITCSS